MSFVVVDLRNTLDKHSDIYGHLGNHKRLYLPYLCFQAIYAIHVERSVELFIAEFDIEPDHHRALRDLYAAIDKAVRPHVQLHELQFGGFLGDNLKVLLNEYDNN